MVGLKIFLEKYIVKEEFKEKLIYILSIRTIRTKT